MLGFRLTMLSLLVPLALLGCDSGGDGDDGNAENASGSETTAGETAAETGETGSGSVCEVETRDDDFVIGLSKSGTLVTASFMSADPAPPIKGDNTWVIEFTELGGTPLTGATITAVPMMPDHGHGTPIDAVVT